MWQSTALGTAELVQDLMQGSTPHSFNLSNEKFHFLRRCQHYFYPNPPVHVTPEHTTAINSQCWTGSEGGHHHVVCEVRKLTAYLLRNL